MEQFIPALVVVAIVAYFMQQNLNDVIGGIDDKKARSKDKSNYDLFVKYSNVVERYVEFIQNEVEKGSTLESPKYILKEDIEKEKVLELINDILKKLAFFETVYARDKSNDDLNEKLFESLDLIDTLVNDNFNDGVKLANILREKLQKEYQRLLV